MSSWMVMKGSCGLMIRHQTSDLRIAGSSPVTIENPFSSLLEQLKKKHTYHRDLIREMEEKRRYPTLLIAQHVFQKQCKKKKPRIIYRASRCHFGSNLLWIIHTAWIGIWMTKRPGTRSDNGFIPKIEIKITV